MKRSFIIALLILLSISGCSFAQKNENTISENVVESITDSIDVDMVNEAKPEAFDFDIKNNSLAVSPDEKIAIVSNSTIDEIKIYDLENKKQLGTLDEVVTPRHVEFSKDNKYFYISDSSYGSIREFDAKTLEEVRSFDVGKGVFGFTLTNNGDKIFANNQDKSTVTLIDLTTGKIEKVIEGFDQPRQGIVIDSNDEYVYVTNFKGNDVRVINTSNLEIEKTLTGIPSVRAISIDTENKILYGASSSENTINVLNVETGEVIKTIHVGKEPYGAALSNDKKIIISGEKVSNQLSIIDTEKLEVVKTIEGLNEPRQAIIYSQGDGKAYVLNADLSISVVDYNEGKILDTIK